MNRIIKPTWKNVLICFVLFYVVGDLITILKMVPVEMVQSYKDYRKEVEYQKYINSDEYKEINSDEYKEIERIRDSTMNSTWKEIESRLK